MSYGPGSDDAQSSSEPPNPPVCAQHPDRVSYIRCQRCEKPACPECQRPAAVGIHCVVCVKAAAAAAPVIKTVLGAPATVRRPYATYTIIAACLVVYLGQLIMPGLTSNLAFVPGFGVAREPWRILTHAFAHSASNPLHLAFNMYAVYLAGSFLEVGLGRWRFLWLYLASLLAGAGLFSVIAGPVVHSDSGPYLSSAIGASGAVFGLFGALLMVQRKLGRDTSQLMVILGINAVLGFVIPGIAWEAHLGGFIAGALVAFAVLKLPKNSRGTWLLCVVLTGICLLSVAGIVLKQIV